MPPGPVEETRHNNMTKLMNTLIESGHYVVPIGYEDNIEYLVVACRPPLKSFHKPMEKDYPPVLTLQPVGEDEKVISDIRQTANTSTIVNLETDYVGEYPISSKRGR